MREAPAVPLIHGLLAAGAMVHAYDPEAMKVAQKIFGSKIQFADTSYAALTGADALADRHRVERVPRARLRAHAEADAQPVIFDGRNIYNPESMRAQGFHVHLDGAAVGDPRARRPPSSSPAAPATSAATRSRRCARAARPSIVYDNFAQGHRAATRHASRRRRRRHPRYRAGSDAALETTASTP